MSEFFPQGTIWDGPVPNKPRKSRFRPYQPKPEATVPQCRCRAGKINPMCNFTTPEQLEEYTFIQRVREQERELYGDNE